MVKMHMNHNIDILQGSCSPKLNENIIFNTQTDSVYTEENDEAKNRK